MSECSSGTVDALTLADNLKREAKVRRDHPDDYDEEITSWIEQAEQIVRIHGVAQAPSREAREKEITRLATIEECANVARAMAVQMLNEMATPPSIRGLGPDNSHLKYGHRIADRIESDIKGLAVSSTSQGRAAIKHSGTFLGYRDEHGNEMHCAHAFCPHQAKCQKGCAAPVAATSTDRGAP